MSSAWQQQRPYSFAIGSKLFASALSTSKFLGVLLYSHVSQRSSVVGRGPAAPAAARGARRRDDERGREDVREEVQPGDIDEPPEARPGIQNQGAGCHH